ncbi:MAG: acylphosphatase [Bacteroidales bacterium]|nr:acylphosphatase [Bacteroidales bacterium]
MKDNYKHIEILIYGDLRNKGYGFTVMKNAYKLRIKGILTYKEGGSIFIEAEGTQSQISSFRAWCEDFFSAKQLQYGSGKLMHYREFNLE